MKISFAMKLATATRQLEFMRSTMPRLVAAGRLAPDVAQREIETMAAIVADCQWRVAAAEARLTRKYGVAR